MEKLKNEILYLLRKYRELISYAFWGVFATVTNIVSYFLCYDVCHIPNVPSTMIAWALAVLVAFVTNKLWVFNSRNTTMRQTVKELISFTACRAFSGIFDLGIMYLAVDVMHSNGLFWKIVANVIVIILNYVFSKFFIFKNTETTEHAI